MLSLFISSAYKLYRGYYAQSIACSLSVACVTNGITYVITSGLIGIWMDIWREFLVEIYHTTSFVFGLWLCHKLLICAKSEAVNKLVPSPL